MSILTISTNIYKLDKAVEVITAKEALSGPNQSLAGRCPREECSESGLTGREQWQWEQDQQPPSGWSAASL